MNVGLPSSFYAVVFHHLVGAVLCCVEFYIPRDQTNAIKYSLQIQHHLEAYKETFLLERQQKMQTFDRSSIVWTALAEIYVILLLLPCIQQQNFFSCQSPLK